MPTKLIGIHVNLLAVRREPNMLSDPTPEERKYLDELAHWLKEETGYQWIQGTRPQTLSFGLTDSPAGLAAWIVEKFRAWSDCNGDVESAFTRDQLLANISLYWFTGAIGSSFFPYYFRMHRPWPIPEGGTIAVPTRLQRVSARDSACAAIARRAYLYRYPPVDRHVARRPLRGHGAAGGAGRRDPGVLSTTALTQLK